MKFLISIIFLLLSIFNSNAGIIHDNMGENFKLDYVSGYKEELMSSVSDFSKVFYVDGPIEGYMTANRFTVNTLSNITNVYMPIASKNELSSWNGAVTWAIFDSTYDTYNYKIPNDEILSGEASNVKVSLLDTSIYEPSMSYYDLTFTLGQSIELLPNIEYWIGFSLGSNNNNTNAYMIGGFTAPLFQSYQYASEKWFMGASGTVFTLYDKPQSVPEPSSGALWGLSLLLVFYKSRTLKYNKSIKQDK